MQDIIGGNGAGAPAGAPGADAIKDSDTQNFANDVLAASQEVPVIVDFWAPWCGPCKQLTPVLEKVVGEAQGQVRLVKINVDENQQLAQQLRIQSIPTVYAFFRGQPVDGFQGALPESQLKQFIEQLIQSAGGNPPGPSHAEQLIEAAGQAMEQGDHASAAQAYAHVLQHEPENAPAAAGLIRAYVELGEVEAARQFVSELPATVMTEDAVAAAVQLIELADAGAGSEEIPKLREAVEANPKDHQARIDLAMALYSAGDREAALDELLESIAIDRDWNDQAARKQLLQYFEALGPADPLVASARRRLGSLLFS
jgi:putative thioredoxin